MGLIGIVINGARGIYGLATGDYDLVDDATERARKSMFRTLFDPIGVIDVVDVVDVVSDIAEGDL